MANGQSQPEVLLNEAGPKPNRAKIDFTNPLTASLTMIGFFLIIAAVALLLDASAAKFAYALLGVGAFSLVCAGVSNFFSAPSVGGAPVSADGIEPLLDLTEGGTRQTRLRKDPKEGQANLVSGGGSSPEDDDRLEPVSKNASNFEGL